MFNNLFYKIVVPLVHTNYRAYTVNRFALPNKEVTAIRIELAYSGVLIIPAFMRSTARHKPPVRGHGPLFSRGPNAVWELQ